MAFSQDWSGKLVGEYRLQRRLGSGSFGEVYQAENVRDHSPAAVKLIKTPLTRREDLKAFLNEARSMRLRHPHIVPLLDFGLSEHDLPFLVMEYIAGGTLRDRYPKGSQVPLHVVEDLTTQLASALQYAHDQHLVHRDVKPENMLCRTDATALLSDFGIASVAHSSGSLSAYQSFGGTLPYMAPEQYTGKPRPASDQYALAVVVYEWLAGARPFNGTATEIALQHLQASPPSLLAQNPVLPSDVEKVVMKALAKRAEDRFASVQDFARALHEACQPTLVPPTVANPSAAIPFSMSKPSIPFPPSLASPSPFAIPSPPPPPSATRQIKHPPLIVMVLILLAVLLAGAGSFSIYGTATGNWPWAANASLHRSSTSTSSVSARSSSTSFNNVPALTWHTQSFGTSQYLGAVVWADTQFVVVGSNTILTSPNGHTWTPHPTPHLTSPVTQGSVDLNAVMWSGKQFVAVGQLGALLTSSEGSTWTPQYVSALQAQPVDLSAGVWAGTQFVVVGARANAQGIILTSPDGSTWTPQNAGLLQDLSGVAWSNTLLVAVGQHGTILTSPDGSTWTPQHSSISQDLYAVVWSGKQFIAVGQHGTILTSPNGNTWTSRHSGTSQNLWGVAWVGTQFVAVGEHGTILTSPESSTWTLQPSGISQDFGGVAWSGKQIVIVGNNGTILTSS